MPLMFMKLLSLHVSHLGSQAYWSIPDTIALIVTPPLDNFKKESLENRGAVNLKVFPVGVPVIENMSLLHSSDEAVVQPELLLEVMVVAFRNPQP